MAPLVEQTKKDNQLLQSQRSAHHVGVVVGNLLGGLYQKAVELVDSVEDSFQNCFVNEQYAYCYLLRSVFIHCDTQVRFSSLFPYRLDSFSLHSPLFATSPCSTKTPKPVFKPTSPTNKASKTPRWTL